MRKDGVSGGREAVCDNFGGDNYRVGGLQLRMLCSFRV